AEGEQELGPVPDDAPVLLLRAGEESGHVDEGEERDVEAVAEPHEASGLDRRVDVERAREDLRLVPDDADGSALEAGEAHYDVLRPSFVDLEPRAAVHHAPDYIPHVVRLVRFLRDD